MLTQYAILISGIPRTPLHVPIFDTPPDTPEPMPRLVLSDQLETPDQRRVSDPRSPNCEVERTPVIADCDVHRSWPADQSIGQWSCRFIHTAFYHYYPGL